jgi:hypothetical protein
MLAEVAFRTRDRQLDTLVSWDFDGTRRYRLESDYAFAIVACLPIIV